MSELLISFYGDDFTGSTDAMESLTRAGLRTILFIEPPDAAKLARYPGLRAVGIAGLTRSMPPAAMEAELRPAFTKLKALGAPIVHYKVCSTFDSSPTVGSIGKAIDVGREVFSEAPFVPMVVGAPALGRYCVFGNLFARLGRSSDPFRLDRHPSMSRHPTTPADESDLRVHLSRQTDKRAVLFDVLKLEYSADARRTALDALLADRPDIVLFDVLHDAQLERIGQLIDSHATRSCPLFVVGSSGVGAALTAHWRLINLAASPMASGSARRAGPLLVVSGSCSPVTAGQIAWARSRGFAEVVLDVSAISETTLRFACEAAAAHLSAGRHVVVHTGGVRSSRVAPQALGNALAAVVHAGAMRANVKRVLIAGGDTSGYLARALGVEALEVIAPLTPGAPLCRAHAASKPIDGLELNFKGGQVGGSDYFVAVADGRGSIE